MRRLSPSGEFVRRIGIVAIVALVFAALAPVAEARCVLDTSFCSGCGCKGGPGWRHIASGRCVGFRELAAKCGEPPSPLLCDFENAPGTGANRECARAPAVPPPRGPIASPSRP